jgi:hypothetical protein
VDVISVFIASTLSRPTIWSNTHSLLLIDSFTMKYVVPRQWDAMASWVTYFRATVPGWPVPCSCQPSWCNDVSSYQCTPGHTHATERNQVANRNKPGFVSEQMIRAGVILHQKHVLIGLKFWKLYQSRFFIVEIGTDTGWNNGKLYQSWFW